MTARGMAAPSIAERGWDDAQFKVIFALSFAVYLPIATIARLMPAHQGGPSRSIFATARAAAGTTAQMAFAG